MDTSPGPEECLGPVQGVTILILSFVVRDGMVGSSAECKRLRLRPLGLLEDGMAMAEEETVLRLRTLLCLPQKLFSMWGFILFNKGNPTGVEATLQ